MSEFSPSDFAARPTAKSGYEQERTPEEAKRYEAREIAAINEVLWDLFEQTRTNLNQNTLNVKSEADAALDNLENLALSLGQRDPEMGRILIEELESGPHGTDQTISERMRETLRLPPRETPTPPSDSSSLPTEHSE